MLRLPPLLDYLPCYSFSLFKVAKLRCNILRDTHDEYISINTQETNCKTKMTSVSVANHEERALVRNRNYLGFKQILLPYYQ